MSTFAHALVYVSPGEARIEEVGLPDLLPGMVEVETIASGLSRGTERLVYNGQVPQAEWNRMRAPMQVGDFPFPVRYGYACAGRVVAGPEVGRLVFALHPHQTRFRVPEEAVLPLPDGLSARRAILAANTETALNAIWDAQLAPGARCLVVGAGMVGWLITALLSPRVDLTVHVTDVRQDTGVKADDFGVRFMTPADVQEKAYDVAFHCSASSSGLQTAIDALDFEGKLLELSWYGEQRVDVMLGGNFHANRLQIISSQVGHVAPARRASYDYRDRLAAALDALTDPRFEDLITEDVAFFDLPGALPDLLAPDATGIATRIVYD